MSTTDERLHGVLRVACEDALFAILGTGPKLLDFVARKRAQGIPLGFHTDSHRDLL